LFKRTGIGMQAESVAHLQAIGFTVVTPDELFHGFRPPPAEVVVRHEAGHAVMAWHLGCYVRWIVYGITPSGWPHAVVDYLLPRDVHGKVLVQMAGVLALYLHDVPGPPSAEQFLRWVDRNEDKAASGAGDWGQILELTGKPPGHGWDYHLRHAVMPHFAEAATILANKRDQLDALTCFLLDRPRGAGRARYDGSGPACRRAAGPMQWTSRAFGSKRPGTPAPRPRPHPHRRSRHAGVFRRLDYVR
jgi:hypothetical protein